MRKFPVNSSVTVCRKVHEEGRAIAQAVSRRVFTAENRLSACESSDENRDTESYGFPLSILFHRCYIFTHVLSGGWAKGTVEAHFHIDIDLISSPLSLVQGTGIFNTFKVETIQLYSVVKWDSCRLLRCVIPVMCFKVSKDLYYVSDL